jgi:hypothetical protein
MVHSTRSASNKVYQLLAHGRWFSPGTPAFSTTKTSRHDIAEILLKVALNTKNQINPLSNIGIFVVPVIFTYWFGFNLVGIWTVNVLATDNL